jgi:hypothetical protein
MQNETLKTKYIGKFYDLREAIQRAANYWGGTVSYHHTRDPNEYLIKEANTGEEVGLITQASYRKGNKRGSYYFLKMRPKDPIFELIEHDDKVTITTRHNQKLTGVARIRNDKVEAWVCAKGDNTFLASQENVCQVKRGQKVIYGRREAI